MRLPGRWVPTGNGPFVRLWFGQTVSQIGSQVSLIAIPLLAVLSLGATPVEMGVLTAAETAPYLLVSLPAGVVADRVDRRVMMILCDLGRALGLLVIPVFWAAGLLSLPLLAVTAFVIGSLSVAFDIAAQTYLPEIVPPDYLVPANQQLELATSGAQVAGPGIAGILFGLVGGAMAVVIDALSYLVSAISLMRFRRPGRTAERAERRPAAAHRPVRVNLRSELLDGPRLLLRDPILRELAASTAAFNLASSMILATFVLFATRELGVGPSAYGLVFALGNVGFVIGAAASGWTARRGLGRAMLIGAAGSTVAALIIPLAIGPFAFLVLVAGRFLGALANPVYNVSLVALVQSRTDRDTLGRINGTFRLADWGVVPVGALLGGVLGETIGLRPTLFVAAGLATLRLVLLLKSRLGRIDETMAAARAEAPASDTRALVPDDIGVV
ncbi:MAG TPA: MFS transporter [Candidatus Limnocylindrales bacterium]|jgi:MFS family permease|nr:MFS transporter [Candidatus Limnocylindrales bacterium]